MPAANEFEAPIVAWLRRHAVQGILITDADLIVRDWNVWLEVNSGIHKSDVIGKHLFDLFPDLPKRGLNILYEAVLSGQVCLLSQRFHRYLIEMPSPSEPDFEQMQQTAQIAPLMDGSCIIGTVTAINDVTERAARERELRTAREAAESANRSKDRFVAMLSHDLRVPLSSVIGWVRLMKTKRDHPELWDRALKSIEQSSMTQLRMIEDLLDVNRISSGKLELDFADTDIVSVVEDACNVLKPLADAKGIRLEPSIQIQPTTISADPKRMEQVVWNLVANALKFTPPGGTVQVQLESSAGVLRLSVSDTGIGLNEDAISHIFEPMWQSEESGDRKGGLGLGLTIVRKVVELHGGSVRAESPGVGKGTTFVVEIPSS